MPSKKTVIKDALNQNSERVTVIIANYSQAYKRLAEKQFGSGKVLSKGCILFGKLLLQPGIPYTYPMSIAGPMIRSKLVQVLHASIHGPKK